MRRNNIFGLEYLQYGGGGAVGGATGASPTPSTGAASSASKEDSPNVIQGEGNNFWVAKVKDNQTGKKLYSIEEGVSKSSGGSSPAPTAPKTASAPAPKGGGALKMNTAVGNG